MNNGDFKQLLLWLNDSAAKPISRSLMQRYAKHYGATGKLIYVGGYPKSGTTWVSKMIAHYIALPWIGHTYLALGFPAVIHHHWDYHPAFDRSIVVTRDGRDVMVSIYMNLIKGYLATEESLAELGTASPGRLVRRYLGRHAALRRRLRYLYGPDFEPWDVVTNLPKFIDAEMQKPFIPEARTPWPQYVADWRNRSRQATFVKYEDMLERPTIVLSSLIQTGFHEEARSEDISYVVQRFSFTRMTGRRPGEEDRQSFARKGVAGDWVSHFSPESREVFDHYAGDVLMELGYEADRSWVQQQGIVPDATDDIPSATSREGSR